ncbi:MAG TPA: GNAT family N-acetyltransferase [Rhizomicrobium sp.]|jgi:RimJ/RimL family protein N-acetyltransferase
MKDPPRAIASARLVLRLPTLADFDESAAMYSDAGVVRHIGGRPFTREESWARLMRHVGHWHLMGYGFWVVRERIGGRFVGEVGFAEFRRDIEPRLEGTPEIGWVLSPDAHGRGYATEAASAGLGWFDRHAGKRRTVCMIEPENAASLRVAAKCGYSAFARTTYRNSSVMLLERLPHTKERS